MRELQTVKKISNLQPNTGSLLTLCVLTKGQETHIVMGRGSWPKAGIYHLTDINLIR